MRHRPPPHPPASPPMFSSPKIGLTEEDPLPLSTGPFKSEPLFGIAHHPQLTPELRSELSRSLVGGEQTGVLELACVGDQFEMKCIALFVKTKDS